MKKYRWPDIRSKRYKRAVDKLNLSTYHAMDKLLGEGPWTDTCHVVRKGSFQFCGVELTLYPDGTYDLGDTSGG
jgi:hypothetical protein